MTNGMHQLQILHGHENILNIFYFVKLLCNHLAISILENSKILGNIRKMSHLGGDIAQLYF